MTKPVAYRVKDVSETFGWRYSTLKPVTKNYEPLYTAAQLYSRLKWFVRSKKSMSNGEYLYLENTISNNLAPEYHQINLAYAQQFETKEDADKWTNPLTEAVQLPVEDK